jgi:hypothetical protein
MRLSETWRCESCWYALAEERLRAEFGPRDRFVRVVDFYYPSGKTFRDIFLIIEELKMGRPVAAWLYRQSRTAELARVTDVSLDPKYRSLVRAFRHHLNRERKRTGAIIDCPMPWTRTREFALWTSARIYSDFSFPRRYVRGGRPPRWVRVSDEEWDVP